MFSFLTRGRHGRRSNQELGRTPPADREVIAKSIDLFNRAKESERAGDHATALRLYNENLRRYATPGISHWERPAILLEKLGRYHEALDICERALALNVEHKPTARAFQEEFTKRKRRLLRKLGRSR